VAGIFQEQETILVVEDNEHPEWATLSSAVGEALLDVERTFLDVVERQSKADEEMPLAAEAGPALRAYLSAKSRLDDAHRGLARYLAGRRASLHLMELRCGQCLRELR
jgi:hypothetical protein